MTGPVMNEWDYERLKRRHDDLMTRAREAVEEARRIRQQRRHASTPGSAWNSRIAGRNRGEGGET
ncbi:hypothetical protein [Azospirillum endophyticum]